MAAQALPNMADGVVSHSNAFAMCTVGHYWCRRAPYGYHCESNGAMRFLRQHASCDTQCWCGAEEIKDGSEEILLESGSGNNLLGLLGSGSK